MSRTRNVLCVIISAALLPTLGAEHWTWKLLGYSESPELCVWTEMTDAGRRIPTPTPEQPIYYQAINVGYQTFARGIGGDREPPGDEFLQLVLKQLAAQGYLPSKGENHPTMVLGFSWGDLRGNLAASLLFLGGDRYDLLGYIDPFRYGVPRPVFGGPRYRLLSLAKEPLYVVTIAAYDRDAAIRGDLIKLWQTRIACPTRGFYAMDALPKVLVAAAPWIGRETTDHQWMSANEVTRRTNVEIGELVTLDTSDVDEAILLDLPSEKAKAESRDPAR